MDLLDALVVERGRVPAAQVLGVNYRTLALCCDSRQSSRRMRPALVEFRMRGVWSRAGDGCGRWERPGTGGDEIRARLGLRGWFHPLAACSVSAI